MRSVSRLFATALALLLLTIATQAQSGRRGTGSSTTVTTAPSVSGPKPIEKKADPAPRLLLLVGIDSHSAFTNIPFYIYDTVLENCIRRLGEADIVMPTSGGNNMNRAEARKAAKQETKRWVISLEVRSVSADSGRQVRNGQYELYVDYAVIEPETGSVKRSGRTSVIYQNGRGGVTSPTRNGGIYSDYSIKQAAREAADRILAGFDIQVRERTY